MGTATTPADLGNRLRSPGPLLTTLAVNLIVIPAVAVWIIGELSNPSAPALALVIVAASPGGGTGALLSFHARGDVAHAVTLQVLLAAGSLITMPLWIALYMASRPAGDISLATLVWSLLGYQLLPLLLGLTLRSTKPTWAAPIHTQSRRLADVSLAVLIAVLLVASGSDVRSISAQTFIAILGLALLTVALGAVGPGQPAVRRSATMTTLVRNLSLALMAASLAPNPALTSLVILTYGLVMYLLALAFVRYSRRTTNVCLRPGRLGNEGAS